MGISFDTPLNLMWQVSVIFSVLISDAFSHMQEVPFSILIFILKNVVMWEEPRILEKPCICISAAKPETDYKERNLKENVWCLCGGVLLLQIYLTVKIKHLMPN